jgi:uncharacterized OB-fold protein
MNTTVQTASKPKATLPDPDINEVSKPYWDALKKGKLTFQHCRKCGNNWLPARGECPKCLEADWAWHDASGKAKLISWVVFHRAFHPAFEDRLPYNVAVVELAEGPRMITNIVVEDAEKLVIDQPLTFMPAEEQGHGIARFRPV